mgnify:CR=1 FL=1
MSSALLLTPDFKISKWQSRCIASIANEVKYIYIPRLKHELADSLFPKIKLRHVFYYLLNLRSIRQPKIQIDQSILKHAEIRYLEYSLTDKNWAKLDEESVQTILNDSPEYIYKCGLGLLYIPTDLEMIPIISHHHGDPRRYRGRPAGFYEILNDESVMGQIVQVLSNELDAGRILAYGESKISRWSYKKTLKDAYSVSPYVFKNAISSFRQKKEVHINASGRNYRLPTNQIVFRIFACLIIEKLKRFVYGAFFEKHWNIAIANNFLGSTQDPLALLHFACSQPQGERPIRLKNKYLFYADSFLLDDKIFLEGLRKFDGVGELLELDPTTIRILNVIRPNQLAKKHLAYPYALKHNSTTYIYPDSSQFEAPFLLLRDDKFSANFKTMTIDIPFLRTGVTDPSVVSIGDKFYMFGTLPEDPGVLRLWVGDDCTFSNAFEHECSPVHIGPTGCRSGGRIFVNLGSMYRIAQDLSRRYGDGLCIYKIVTLTPSSFEECFIKSVKFERPVCGPHTFDANDSLICWDYYFESFSLLAGLRRLIAMIKSKL